ncbi:hypothetical protein M8312_01125 [Sphingomonas sp. KRR8]|uniref:hypothetical protein n=1 Tax=Sphingomonas sp. KRR8 TaxID=2942996 RepID=UPI002020D2E3|nr:hypothetical protein [Sphingomonas sp. KRR8]URD61151.1 hypothetical protein M8312_01125 [Sphingomonas sp. KRR8]
MDDFLIDAVTLDTAANGIAGLGANSLAVIDELVPGTWIAEACEAPDFHVVFQRGPGAIQEDRDALHRRESHLRKLIAPTLP